MAEHTTKTQHDKDMEFYLRVYSTWTKQELIYAFAFEEVRKLNEARALAGSEE